MDLELENARNPESDLLANFGNSLLIGGKPTSKKSMSFASMQRGGDASDAAYRSMDHDGASNLVRKSIEELQGDLAIAARLVEAIGGPRDTPEQRAKMTTTIERCAGAARSVSDQLERLDASDRQKKQIKQKLQADFMKLRADFQHVSTLAKQRLALAATKSKSAAASSSRSAHAAQDDEARSLLNDEAARADRERQEALLMQQETTYNNARILEQQEQFKAIEKDVAQIEEIFKDLSMLVGEQGIQIDNIEQNIVNSRDSAKAAHQDITDAEQYQKSTRAKMCWCALFFALAGLLLLLWVTNSF